MQNTAAALTSKPSLSVLDSAAVGLKAAGAWGSGQEKAQADNLIASQYDQSANFERGVGEAQAGEIATDAKRVMSTQTAYEASGGGGADSGTAIAVAGDTAKRSELEQLIAQANTDDRANYYQNQATAQRIAATTAQRTGAIDAVSTVLQGGANWYQKYGKPSGKTPAAAYG